jgi:hypothetical protein
MPVLTSDTNVFESADWVGAPGTGVWSEDFNSTFRGGLSA